MTRGAGRQRLESIERNFPQTGRRGVHRVSQEVRRTRRDAPAWLGPAYLRARSALVRKIEARLPARGHLAADFLDLPRVKDSRGNRKHFSIFNRDVTLV